MGSLAAAVAIWSFLLGCFVVATPELGQGQAAGNRGSIEDAVHFYETLSYDRHHVDSQHRRHKRSPAGGRGPQDASRDGVALEFEAHGRTFGLRLKRDLSMFHNDLVVEDQSGRPLDSPDLAHIYEGHLAEEGPSESHCFGAIRDGVFDGQIETPDGTFYVERAQKYFPDASSTATSSTNDSSFHSVIYHERHLKSPHSHPPHRHRLGGRAPGCGVSDSIQQWMESVQRSAVPEAAGPTSGTSGPASKAVPVGGDGSGRPSPYLLQQLPSASKLESHHRPWIVVDQDVDPVFKYKEEANRRPRRFTDEDDWNRAKRAMPHPNNRKSCSLYIQTDPLFWRHIYEQERDPDKTKDEILSIIAQHVKAVNRIYSDTTFDGKYRHHGYQFEVQRIKIHNDSHCGGFRGRTSFDRADRGGGGGGGNPEQKNHFESRFDQSSSSSYSSSSFSNAEITADTSVATQFCLPNIDVSNFLNMHSKSNHEEFCLAYVFTYRDFVGGTLGLAWVASASGASGGICETYKSYRENVDGEHVTAKRSLNTGIITFVNYNSRVPPKVSQLTLAHEIGHNFGSPHDFPDKCRPGGQEGNFIMFASATSGDRYNNNKFSVCSKENVSAVLDAIADGQKTPNCFTESDGAFCGNKIVEAGEECDCGFDEIECAEQCCYPRRSSDLTEHQNKVNRCKRKPGAECSPSEGPCCDHKCRHIPEYQDVLCKAEDDCTAAAVCGGDSARCPVPGFKPDNVTECNQGTQVCQAGECKDSICLKYGLASCFLSSDLVSDKRQLCELACQRPGNNHTCMATSELVKAGLMPGLVAGLSLRPGSPCDNFQGYCDVFLKCRKVDAEGPLVKLKNFLFNQETLLTIAQWVTEYWYAVLLMGIGFVIFMAVFIKCFAIHTPSSNPRLPKNLHFTETLRRPVRSFQHKHYRPAANGGPNSEAPPPYPGRGGGGGGGPLPQPGAVARPQGAPGPGRGYGEGRGHYNRHKANTGGGGNGSGGAAGPHHPSSYLRNGDRRSAGANRNSRIEMQPMR